MTRKQTDANQVDVDRRKFISTITKGLGGLAVLGGARPLSASEIEPENRQRIPYVDGLTLGLGGIGFADVDELRDLPASGLSAVITDVSAGEMVKAADGSARYFRSFDACARSIVGFRQRLRQHRRIAILGTAGRDVKEAFNKNKTAVFLQFQGCEPMGEDLSRIDLFHELGLRVLQITHHHNNAFGGGCIEKTWTGLTKLGFQGVERMNTLGIIPDLAHASDPTSLDVLMTSKKPVIISHGAARALVNNARCAPDEVIRGVAASGGVTGIFMMSFWLTTEPEPTVESLLKQIRHVIKVGGIDSVGIANDYSLSGQPELAKQNNNNREGVKSYFPWWDSVAQQGILGFEKRPEHVVIPELNNIRRMFTIHRSLEKAGFKSAEVEKIIGGNWIRVLTESLG